MEEREEVENKPLDVKFYPIKNRYLENLIRGVHRLLWLLILLCLIIGTIVLADFSGYALQDIRKWISEVRTNHVIESGTESVSSLIHSIENPSMFAGHSSTSLTGSNAHRRESHHSDFAVAADDTVSAAGFYGIDVSHWQQQIDWEQAAGDTVPHPLRFAIIKATQGAGHLDPEFLKNREHANLYFEISGAYHFYIFQDDPVEQAKNYIRNVSLETGNFPPVADVEYNCSTCDTLSISREQLIRDLKTFLNELESHYRVSPIIYSGESFYQEYLSGHFDEYHFWIAKYDRNPPPGLIEFETVDPEDNQHPNVVMWQFTNSERISGIIGRVNMNYMPAAARDSIRFVE